MRLLYMKSSFSIYLFAYALYVFWATSGYGNVGNYLASGFCIIVLFLNLNRFKQKRTYSLKVCEDKSALYFLLFFLFHTLTSLFNVSDYIYWAGNVMAYTFVSFFPILLQRHFARINSRCELIRLLKITSIVWLFMVSFSIVYYAMNPDSARDAIVYQDQYDNLFIGGGYYLAYGSCIMAVFLFGLYRNGLFRNRKQKLLVLCAIAVLSVHVLLTKSTLTSIWLFVGLLLDIVFGMKLKKEAERDKKKLIVVSIIIILVFSFVALGGKIGELMMTWFDYSSESVYSRRLYELGTVLRNAEKTRHTMERFSKPVMSWSKFVESPIFGIGYKHGYTYSEMKRAGLGTHSELVDTLAKYGIVGTLPWVAMFVNLIRSIQNRFKQNATGSWIVILLCLMFFNPFVSMPSMIALGVMIPLISMVVTQ